MRRRDVLAVVLLAVAAAAYSTGPLYRIRTWWGYRNPLADDTFVLTVYGLIAVVAIVVLVDGGRWRQLPKPFAVTAALLLLWLLLSTLWSVDPPRTGRESLFIGGSLAVGAAAALVLSPRWLARATWLGLQLGLGWSFLAIGISTRATRDTRGDFVGVYFNRNSLGLYAVLGALVGVVLALDAAEIWRRTRSRVDAAVVAVFVLAVACDLVLVVGSGALTPVLAGGAALATMATALIVRRVVPDRVEGASARIAGLGGIALAAVLAIAWAARDTLVDQLGRRGDLTGRTGIWEVALDRVAARPLLGYGYMGLWEDRGFVADVRAASGHRLSAAHSSFIEALLGTGVVGLSLLIAFMASVYFLTASVALRCRGVLALLALGVFVFVLFENLTETLVVGNQLTVVLLAAGAVAAGNSVPEGRPLTGVEQEPEPVGARRTLPSTSLEADDS